MRRREFITLLGGAAAAWPLAARAQQLTVPVVGVLRSTSFSGVTHLATAFGQGLKEAGFVEGQNVAVEYLAAEGRPDRLRALVAELVRRPVAVIVANSVAASAAKDVTATIPIVFTTGSDPVRDGLVASLNRPGGNVTGVSFLAGKLGAKRLDLLRQLAPTATTIGAIVNPSTTETEGERTDLQAAAQAIGQQLVVLDVNNERDLEPAFATLIQRGVGILLVGTGAFMFAQRERIVALAARHAVPAMHNAREAVVAGGLMSYGPGQSDAYRQAGTYAGRILKGEKPSDLPVVQSTKFELVLNLKTAKTLGFDIPPTLLALADEVIE